MLVSITVHSVGSLAGRIASGTDYAFVILGNRHSYTAH